MNSHFFPNLFSRCSRGECFGFDDIAFVAQNVFSDVGGLHGAFQMARKNQAWLHARIGHGL